MEIELDWPPKELSPNARIHYMAKSRKTKKYRHDCWAITMSAEGYPQYYTWLEKYIENKTTNDFISAEIIFHPPNKRPRDDDNCIASFKSGRDGIADALGVDDKIFRPNYSFGEPVKGGRVVVKI